jgi:hypothetical protein
MKEELHQFLRRSRIRLLVWFAFVLLVSIIAFIVCGYFAASKPVTFLPEVVSRDTGSHLAGIKRVSLKNRWFVLIADENGEMAVKTLKGEFIMSSLTYYSSYEGSGDNWGLKNVSVKLTNDSTISITGKGPSGVFVDESFTIHNYVSKLDVRVTTRYSSDVVVNREALVAKFDVPISEVYLKNRKIDFGPFDSEYWLQDQGVRFGSGSISSLIYHTTKVSSLQLNSGENLLFINLDYFLDHPYIQIPFQKDGGGQWINLSSANYRTNTERENSFSIYFGNLPEVTPRLMIVPYGFTSGYVFTEHADGGNLKTHRAAYFGAEDILNIDDATGGFAAHKIPVTKSVFYLDSARNHSVSSIKDDPDKPHFLDFLNQLYSTGLYDICLHTPEDYSSTRESLEESIKYMKEKFDASTWIDHGMYSGNMNQESFVCDGLNPNSEYFAADLWENYGTRYFWNPASEIIENSLISPSKSIKEGRFYKAYVDFLKHYVSPKDLKKLGFTTLFKEILKRYNNKGELNSLKPNKGNAYPTPLYWQNITHTRSFYSWTTDYVKDYGKLTTNNAEKQFNMEEIQLNEMVANWGIFISHGYFVRNRKGHNIFSEINGKIVINPLFDKILEYMARMRNNGELYLTTIRDLLDYWILIENVCFDYMPDGKINVINLNNEPIKGLSIALHAKTVRINGEIPEHKQVGEETIVWFDIPGKSLASLQVETNN